MVIERYSNVMHIVSNVTGQLREGLSAMDALRAILPAGTLSGAPKIRAMEIIDELEPVKRGVYGGAVGYLAWNGNMDTAIAIRTAVIKNGELHVQAGGGIVADRCPRWSGKKPSTSAGRCSAPWRWPSRASNKTARGGRKEGGWRLRHPPFCARLDPRIGFALRGAAFVGRISRRDIRQGAGRRTRLKVK